MVRAGLLASDLDGSDVARRIRIFNEASHSTHSTMHCEPSASVEVT